ncbi:MAG: sn-glycerol-3-phosphate ABC transporter ATP-binding protein UgpC [Bacteroidota bacterium]
MATVTLENVKKVYDNGFVAVHDASFHIEHGEFIVLVGPSGCGKSTTLRMIAGLESISSGALSIGDRVVNDVAPKDRDIAMVFQNYALYPHLSVYENMAFGLRLRKQPKDEIDRRVRKAAETLGLVEALDRKPKALSGGQRQRVALGRAIVRDPAVFLFDEPLSNLDAKLRVQTRTQISKLHSELDATMIYVTHDQVEAMTMGDRIVVLNDGYVQQIAPPLELYNRPANLFVAGFIGSPAMNTMEGVAESTASGAMFRAPEISAVPLDNWPQASGEVVLGVRPEDLYLAPTAPATKETVPLGSFRLDVLEPMGNEIVVYASRGAHSVVARIEPQDMPAAGSSLDVVADRKKLHLFDAASGTSL